MIAVAIFAVAALVVMWLGGRAYDWILRRAMERASNDTSWSDL